MFFSKNIPSQGGITPLKIIGQGSPYSMHICLCTTFYQNPPKGLGVAKTKSMGQMDDSGTT
jgi:hypothetical protein